MFMSIVRVNQNINRGRDRMIRISGVIIPDNKVIKISLTYIFGIGPNISSAILKKANVDAGKRTKDINGQEEARIREIIDKEYKVENDLKNEIGTNIRRLKEIQSYIGIRHSKNLPVRGQRTKTNARTKRGRKITVGSGRKKSAEKT